MIRVSSDNRGVILIALLWILTAISVIALSFSRESFVEMAAARNARDLSDSYFVARAGIATTVYQLLQRRFVPTVRRLELDTAPEPIELGRVTGAFGDGIYDVDIQDESGKLDLNYVAEERLRGLVEVLGIPKRDGDTIVDSIMDWRDADNLHRINGAEDEFYQTMRPPYKAKNGRFDTVEELLLIRGVTRDYFYGYPERTPDGAMIYRFGLVRFLTVYLPSPNQRINVNSALPEVLISIPGMPPQAAQAIYERRRVKPFRTNEEITREIPLTIPPSALAQLSTESTMTYTLTASAHRENSKVRRVIRAVVRLDPRESTRHRILYWNENVPVL